MEAAGCGQLDMLRWLRGQGCEWNELTCTAAAWEGHLEVLRYAREHGCPWDELTCSSAAGGGRTEVLRYAREQGCPWDEWTARQQHLMGIFRNCAGQGRAVVPWTKTAAW